MNLFASINQMAAGIARSIALFASTAAFTSASLAAPGTADAVNTAKNLARMHAGAQIERTAPAGRTPALTSDARNENPTALIMDDSSLSCALPEGETTFVVKLPGTALLERFSFVNENAEAAGELKLFVSNYQLPAASPKWVEVDGTINFSRKRLFNLSLVGVEARYLKLAFNVHKAGRIAGLGLYGGESVERFAARQLQSQQLSWVSHQVTSRRLEDSLNFNFANLYAKARVVYVSSGIAPAALRMIDDDHDTGFRFDAGDARPTVVVELAQSQRLRRVSARYEMARGRLDVFLLNKLGDNPGDLDGLEPVASATDQDASGKAGVDFHPRGARYVALRWTPEDGSDRRDGFEIVEIDAFGDVPLALLQMNSTGPQLYANNMTGLTFTGQGSTELSNALGTIAIPPALPAVSP